MSYPDNTSALPPPLAGPLKPITEPIQVGLAHAVAGPSPSCINFTAVVTLTVEEWNKIQDRIAKLEADCTRWRTTAEEIAAKLENNRDFDNLWDYLLTCSDFASLYKACGDRRIWFVPSYGQTEAPEFRMKPAFRGLVKWPDHGMDMVTNKKALYTQSGPASSLYSKLTALATANSQPK